MWNVGRGIVSPFTAALACELEPGGAVGEHVQENDDELVIGVAGQGHATVGGTRRRLEPGCVVGIALGQVLTITNDSADTPLRYLIIKARDSTAGPDTAP